MAGCQRYQTRASGHCGTAGRVVDGTRQRRIARPVIFSRWRVLSGSILSHRRLVTEAGRAARARTLAIEYRLAPEHPFPAALDDTLAAWSFLRQAGIAAGHIVVGGDSAGGLTIALINRLRKAGEFTPGCAWLLSPWTDLTLSGSTLVTKDAVDPIIHRAYLAELIEAYLSPASTGRTRCFAALCRSQELSADSDPGRRLRNVA